MRYVKISKNSRRKSKRSRGRKLALPATLALIAVLIGAVTARGLHRSTPSVTASNPLPTARPTPSAQPWHPAQIAAMKSALTDAFAPAVDGIQAYSLVVIDAGGRVLYDARGSQAVVPASVQKLVVAYASLNVLGPSFRFHTILASQHSVSADGALEGALWLVGSGDPSLRSDDVRSGVTSLVRAGMRRIGGVAVDPSAMRGPEINARWNAGDANEDFQTATSAVSLDGDTAEFRIYGGEPGAPAREVIVPASKAIHTYGTIATSTGSDDAIIAAMSQINTFRYSGTIPPYTEEKFWLPVHDIPHYVASVLDAMLREEGVSRAAPPTLGNAPLDSIVLWDHRSAPLRELEKFMLYVSDNHYAEQLLRALGRDSGPSRDDSVSGIVQELRFLASRDIPMVGLRLVDGSGLAESNRIAAITLARILSDAQLRDGGAELDALLPQGGKDGTLKHYDFTTARGRIRAKTGHLSDAASLAGYVDTAHHGRLAFAFMINGSPGDPDEAYVRAVDRLAEF